MADRSLRSPADIANNAFARMGLKMRVGTLLDGSDQAAVMLDLYGNARDTMLREFDYDFAQASVSLTVVKSAPVGGYFPPNVWSPTTNPPVGFMWEYLYPDDALKIRMVKPQPGFVINADPRFYPFTEANDKYPNPPSIPTAPGWVILTNVPNAIAVYTRRVTDPGSWDQAFTESLAARLAALAGPSLVGLDTSKMTVPESQSARMMSELEDR